MYRNGDHGGGMIVTDLGRLTILIPAAAGCGAGRSRRAARHRRPAAPASGSRWASAGARPTRHAVATRREALRSPGRRGTHRPVAGAAGSTDPARLRALVRRGHARGTETVHPAATPGALRPAPGRDPARSRRPARPSRCRKSNPGRASRARPRRRSSTGPAFRRAVRAGGSETRSSVRVAPTPQDPPGSAERKARSRHRSRAPVRWPRRGGRAGWRLGRCARSVP